MTAETGLLYCCYVMAKGGRYEAMTPGEAEFPSNVPKPKVLVQGVVGKSVSYQTDYDAFKGSVELVVDSLVAAADAKKQPLKLDDVVAGLSEKGYSARILSPVFEPKTL